MRTQALNYFQSDEFLNTVQLMGVVSIPYVLKLSAKGFELETVLEWLFIGVLGTIVKGRRDLKANKNLYTNKGIIGTDPEVAEAYVAQNIAVEKATKEVIPKEASDRIDEVANNILNTVAVPDLLKPMVKRTAFDLLGRLFK